MEEFSNEAGMFHSILIVRLLETLAVVRSILSIAREMTKWWKLGVKVTPADALRIDEYLYISRCSVLWTDL